MDYNDAVRRVLPLVVLSLATITTREVEAATYTVDRLESGSGTGLSLAEAVDAANTNPGADTIQFDVPESTYGPGPHLITESSPDITETVVIDGYSQPGASVNTLGLGMGTDAVFMIELHGTTFYGLSVIGADDTEISGLSITRYTGAAIYVEESENVHVWGNRLGIDAGGNVIGVENGVLLYYSAYCLIGGTSPTEINVIAPSDGGNECGVHIEGGGSLYNYVQGNLVGTDPGGSTVLSGFQAGVCIDGAFANFIGGHEAGEPNVLAGATHGVEITGISESNLVEGNYIGTNADGSTALGNEVGVYMDADNNWIGGYGADQGNIIMYNSVTGVEVLGVDNFIAYNLIQSNQGKGVIVTGASGNGIWKNSIVDNGDIGIDLDDDGVTPNDIVDGDVGGNELQNFPVITSVDREAATGRVMVTGYLESRMSHDYRIELFTNDTCDPSGFGEGETYLGNVDLTTAFYWSRTFTYTIDEGGPDIGALITSTAADRATSFGTTSEFSECEEVKRAWTFLRVTGFVVVEWDGSLLELLVELRNSGAHGARNVSAELVEVPPFVTLIRPGAVYGDLPPGSIGEGLNTYQLELSPTAPDWFLVIMEAHYQDPADVVYTVRLPLIVDTRGPLTTPGLPAVAPATLTSYPNPFHAGTALQLGLVRRDTAWLRVYDVSGRLVRELLCREQLPSGIHEVFWDGTDDDGRPVPAGVYLVRAHGQRTRVVQRVTRID